MPPSASRPRRSGWRLFTVLRYVEAEQAVERLHSSDEAAYPVGGRKPLSKITASHGAMERGEVFLAATREDVRKAFFDHELIFSLGITAILNVPIRHAGRRLGTVNLCGEEGMYGPAEIAAARSSPVCWRRRCWCLLPAAGFPSRFAWRDAAVTCSDCGD